MLKKLKNESGFALVLALIIMAAMTAIGMGAIMTSTTDIMIARNEREAKTAFYIAESGIEEAAARLKLPTNNARYIGERRTDSTYRQLAWNVNNALGRDFGKVGDAVDPVNVRQSLDNLDYSVSIKYLGENNYERLYDANDVSPNPPSIAIPPSSKNIDPEEVVMYGQDFNIPAAATKIQRGKLPVYEIRSTGRSGNSSATIVAVYGATALNTDTEYGLNTNGCVNPSGAGAALDVGTLKQADGCGCPLGDCVYKTASDEMDTYLGDDLSEVISFANEKHKCLGATCNNPGDDLPSNGAIENVVQDWGDFAGDSYSTMIYIDNPGRTATLTGNFTGRGILIVTGNLDVAGTLNYEGLIYVFGTLSMNGGGSGITVTGGVMANNTVVLNGTINVNYDQETLEDVSKQNSSSAMLVWKRL